MTPTRSFATIAFALACSGLGATDFGPLMEVAKATWPEKSHYAVVANFQKSRASTRGRYSPWARAPAWNCW
jgi:hypothetical protein